MIELQNIQWKMHLGNPAATKSHEWFRSFNTWIPESPEVFVDVADYSHVEDGPVILLVGHSVSYALDGAGRRLGLLYERRQPVAGSNVEKLRESLGELFQAALRLENDALFAEKPNFAVGDLKFIVNSRALAPNHEDTLTALRPELESLLGSLYGAGNFEIARNLDPRQRFMVSMRSQAPMTVSEALTRLKYYEN